MKSRDIGAHCLLGLRHYAQSDEWVRDEIVWLIIDTEEKVGDRNLERYLTGAKEDIKGWYREAGCEQEEIWIISHQSWRLEG